MLTIAPSFVEFYCLLSSTNDLFCLRSKKEIGNGYRKSENVSGCCLFSIGFDIQLNDYIYAYKHVYSPTHLLMSKFTFYCTQRSLQRDEERSWFLCVSVYSMNLNKFFWLRNIRRYLSEISKYTSLHSFYFCIVFEPKIFSLVHPIT